MARPRKYETPEQMQEVIDEYFVSTDMPTVCGLALALGFSQRKSLLDYEGYEDEPQFCNIIKIAKLKVEESYERDLRTKGIKPTGPIFALKNMKWKDDRGIDHTTDGKPITPQIVVFGENNDS